MSNPFETLSNKFVTDLEEILQCPVCYETLSKTVPSCIQGHHVCFKCKMQLDECPFCKNVFVGTRNYLAENLLLKYNDIKSSLVNPEKGKTIATQTDFNSEDGGTVGIKIDVNENIEKGIDFKIPPVGKGLYPCKIGNCKEELAHGRMMNHIRYYHKQNLIEEKSADSGKYKLEWMYDGSTDNYERVISIPNMGIFYFCMLLQNNGDLFGNVQVINTVKVAKLFNYTLALNNKHTCMSYNGQVLTCRSTADNIKNKSFLINNLMLAQLMRDKKPVKCRLTLQQTAEIDLT